MTKDEAVTVLNARLKRNETLASLTEELRSALIYISGKGLWKVLHTNTSTALATTNNSFVFPTNFRKADRIVLNDGTYDKRPLKETTWDAILSLRAENVSQSEPLQYALRGANIELDYACDKSYTAKTYFWRWHPDQATILFGEVFREAFYNAVMFKYLEGKPEPERSAAYRQICDDELNKLKDTEEDLLPIVATYKDI